MGILQIKDFKSHIQAFEKREWTTHFSRILLKGPRCCLVSEVEVNAFWDRNWWSGLLEYAIPYVKLETRGGWGRIRLCFWRSFLNSVMLFRTWRHILLFKDWFDNAIYGWLKELDNISHIWVKIGRVSVVEQIFSSNEGLQCRFKLSMAIINLTSPQVQESLTKFWHEACTRPYGIVWHDAWKTAPCWLLRRSMSPGCFSWCSLLIPWKSKITKTQSEVSNEYQIRWFKLLDNYLHQDLPENEPTTISTTKKCTTVEDPVAETNFKAAVRWLILTILRSLWHFCVQELPEIELVAITSTTKQCTSVEDRVMETNSKAAVRGLIHIVENPAISDAHMNPEIIWKPRGGRSLNNTVFHGRRERGIKGVADCSSFHTSSIDTRGSWSCS